MSPLGLFIVNIFATASNRPSPKFSLLVILPLEFLVLIVIFLDDSNVIG
ncbi:hypothetical protein X975_17419, partial [Stegodyphus mimosarum]